MSTLIARLIAVVSAAVCLCLSCVLLYPHARMVGAPASDGQKALRIVYPTAKMFGYSTACTSERCGVFFMILDYLITSFPPPHGSTLEERWVLYLGITDRHFNPIPGLMVRLDTYVREGQTFVGAECALGAFDRDFVAVYNVGSDFYYSVFDENGTQRLSKRKIYGNKIDSGSLHRVMSYGFHNRCIYLFLVNAPENMYAGSYSLNVVRHAIDGNETQIMKNFLPGAGDFYNSAKMKTLFRDNILYMAWVNGVKAPGKYAGMYRLVPTFRFASSAVGDWKATVTDIKLEDTRSDFNDADIAFVELASGLSVVMKDGDAIWVQPMNERGALADRPKRTSDPKYAAIFAPDRRGAAHDVKITIGTE